jgi:large subunit ribosomal protein L32
MAVPKKRTSLSRRKQRQAHDKLFPTFSILCPNCGEPVLRHRVCMACGQYRGKQLMADPRQKSAPVVPPTSSGGSSGSSSGSGARA